MVFALDEPSGTVVGMIVDGDAYDHAVNDPNVSDKFIVAVSSHSIIRMTPADFSTWISEILAWWATNRAKVERGRTVSQPLDMIEPSGPTNEGEQT